MPNLPTIQQKYSLQPSTTDFSTIPVSQENRVQTDPQRDYRPRSPTTVHQNNAEVPVSTSTSIQEVQPLLGTTQHETQQLKSVTQPQEIADILGTAVLQGYADTPLKTLDGLYVN